ncbi:MAG: histidinol-phosphate transaminase [Ignavibacteriaceae bacterium]|nr:histidinol-phosphate transaminase [Ignavibacteriaceae bacterium]
MINELVRKNIKELKPYTSARDMYSRGILLDANENSFGSVVELKGESLNRYPDPHQMSMREWLSAYLGIDYQRLFFGVGSDEIIDLLIRIFCEPGIDSIMTLEPTYGMYKVAADINNVKSETVLLNDNFDIDTEAVLSSWNNKIKLIFLCSPNNPTANLLNKQSIEKLLLKTRSIIVVDEAYIDFVEDDASCIGLINQYPNLVILRTFSKAWGLAGIRLGYCIADEEIINYLFKIKAPYNISSLTRKAFHDAFSNISKKDEFVSSILKEKQFIITELNKLPGIDKIFPSDTNYILIKIKDARSVQKKLAYDGIIIRDRSNQPNLGDCLRITVGTHDENIQLFNLLHKILIKNNTL